MRKNMDNGMIYVLGVMGVAVYYIKHATSFGAGVLGVLKALVWPAVAAYKVFQYMHW